MDYPVEQFMKATGGGTCPKCGKPHSEAEPPKVVYAERWSKGNPQPAVLVLLCRVCSYSVEVPTADAQEVSQ
jgi:hypothetical protein